MRSRKEGCSTALHRQQPPTQLQAQPQARLTARPDQEGLVVLPLLEIGHDTVHDMRLGREEVYGVDIAVGRPSLVDLLNVWVVVLVV